MTPRTYRDEKIALNNRAKEKAKEYYLKHKDKILGRQKDRHAKALEYVNSLKRESPCTDCGKCFHPVAMDYDHVRGEKIVNIAYLVNKAFPLESIKEEIEKCELVCSNCHRVRTFANRGNTSKA